MENKLVVFTTRSFLLNTAIEESEHLKRFNIKAKSSLFELKEYDEVLKKQLLVNHIEESELKEELKQDTQMKKNLMKYINKFYLILEKKLIL